jgi:SAM-dependent methyltransferase
LIAREGTVLDWLNHLRSVVTGARRSEQYSDLPAIRYPAAMTHSYYQTLHQTNEAYKTNNWLITEIDAILSIEPRSVLEIGCGNGRFLAAIRERVETIIGVDWAKSPVLEELGIADRFRQLDITRDQLPQADLVCSADVLEHLAPDLLPSTLERLNKAGREQYHVIACYDDGHSHLSIMEPRSWLLTFQDVSKRYRILDIRPRRGDPAQPVCVISTFGPK